MDFLFILGCVIVFALVYNIYRFQKIKKKTIRFEDDFNPDTISDEYMKVMNERVNARKLHERDVS